MKGFIPALWAEWLKARRSKVLPITAAAACILPIIDGVFMFILKDPERAKSMGLINTKAQITAGAADWPTFFQVLLMGTAIAGAILFAFIAAWVFGREHSDHTVKELLALPTRREAIVAAKLVLIVLWALCLTLLIFGLGLGIGTLVDIPGGSTGLIWESFASLLGLAALTLMTMPFVALFASAGRGYLLPLGWAILTLAAAQIASVLGWAEWFPWSVPGLLVSMNGGLVEPIPAHSLIVVLVAFIMGTVATFVWWRNADQAG
jgi:ABC-2 type transport system permease protein